MPKSIPSILLGICLLLSSGGAQVVDGLTVVDAGNFIIGEVSAGIQMFGDGWNSAGQTAATVKANPGFPKKKQGSFELEGVFTHPKSGAFQLSQKFIQTSPGVVSCKYQLRREGPVKLNSLATTLSVPVAGFAGKNIRVDGKEIALPAIYEKGKTSILNAEFQSLEIPLPSGKIKISGPKRLLVQDNREFKGNDFSIRLYFTPAEGDVAQAEMDMTMEVAGLDSQVVDLGKAANMAWADDVDGDGKGGWTDQGKENDLRMIKSGSLMAAGIRFSILDPSAGNTCMVFGGKGRESFPKKIEVPVAGKTGKWLYVLHATAWTPNKGTPVGNLVFHYADGTEEKKPVTAGVEVGDWWNASDLGNGVVVWNATNKSSFVGLYASRFPISPKPLRTIGFEASGNAVWMVAAATVSQDEAVLASVQVPYYVAPGPDWAPISDPRKIEPGSVLDFSFLIPKTGVPAGQFGAVKVVGPHFEFENRPGIKARFAGGNLCFSANYLSHEEADGLTDRLTRMGHNSLRIHHYERNMMDPDRQPASQKVLPAELDKLDYLIASAKKKGIYITTDVFVSRPIKKGDIPGFDEVDQSAYKALVVLGPAREDFKRWAKFLLIDHVNPYTGLPLGKDPVLATLSLVNEGNMTAVWSALPSTQKLTLEMFGVWLAKMGMEEGTGPERSKKFTRFLMEIQMEAVKDMMAYVKGLGVKVPLTDCNMIDNPIYIPLRQEFDFVDTHAYWDHPSFPEGKWKMPYRYGLKQVVKEMASMPSVQAGSRIYGKPFTVTEYQYCFPNPYRAEGSLLMAAVSGLQDWDGLWRFALAHSRENVIEERPISGFDILVDPVNLLGEQLMSLSFLREDIKPAVNGVALVVDENFLKKGDGLPTDGWNVFSKDYSQYAIQQRIGTFMARGNAPTGNLSLTMTPQTQDLPQVNGRAALPLGPDFTQGMGEKGMLPKGYDPLSGKVTSETGEFSLDSGARTFRLDTPRLQAVVLPEGGSVSAGGLTAKSLGQYGIVAAASIDGKDVAKSGRILILHLTEINNSGMKYRNKAKNLVEQWGTSTRLVARGSAEIELAVQDAKGMKLWGCDLSGKRMEEIPFKATGTGISFLAETVKAAKARYMVYELVRN